MIKHSILTALVVTILSVHLYATDGPINSSLPFFTKYTSVTPTSHQKVKTDKQHHSVTITFTTGRGTPVLEQQSLPWSANGECRIYNRIYDAVGKPCILEKLVCTRNYQTVED